MSDCKHISARVYAVVAARGSGRAGGASMGMRRPFERISGWSSLPFSAVRRVLVPAPSDPLSVNASIGATGAAGRSRCSGALRRFLFAEQGGRAEEDCGHQDQKGSKNKAHGILQPIDEALSRVRRSGNSEFNLRKVRAAMPRPERPSTRDKADASDVSNFDHLLGLR